MVCLKRGAYSACVEQHCWSADLGALEAGLLGFQEAEREREEERESKEESGALVEE